MLNRRKAVEGFDGRWILERSAKNKCAVVPVNRERFAHGRAWIPACEGNAGACGLDVVASEVNLRGLEANACTCCADQAACREKDFGVTGLACPAHDRRISGDVEDAIMIAIDRDLPNAGLEEGERDRGSLA